VGIYILGAGIIVGRLIFALLSGKF